MHPDNLDELKAKRICRYCVVESYLRAQVIKQGERRTCTYCDRTAKTFSISEISERIQIAFEAHYIRTPDQPTSWQYSLMSDRESEYDWERDGEPVVDAIMNAAEIPQAAAEDIQQILEDEHASWDKDSHGEESEFDAGSHYEERGTSDAAWQEAWSEFEHGLKTEARFFSHSAIEHLRSVFDHLDQLQTTDGRALVASAGPGTGLTRLYRARAFQSEPRLLEAVSRPDLHLGPPPSELATAGRMNALGISAFYGTNEASVAVAEVQPPVGSQVLVGQFEIIRPLRLLDLTALSQVASGGSIFDSGTSSRMERAMFLRSLSARIARPVMPDHEPFEYLATQAIADFLATDRELDLDGIIFPSVQVAGAVLNVVLFHKAAALEPIDLPVGTEINARSGRWEEDGYETDYEVIEQTPSPPNEETEDASPWGLDRGLLEAGWGPAPEILSPREPTLRVVMDSLRVHIVKKVEYETVEHSVSRRRWAKMNLSI